MVAELLERNLLVQLIKTCRYYRDFLEPLLYRNLDLSNQSSECHLVCLLLHRTLAARPDLLPRILSYNGPPIPEALRVKYTIERALEEPHSSMQNCPVNVTEVPSDEESAIVAKTLFGQMVNLQKLVMIGAISNETADVAETLGANGSGVKLEKLGVHGYILAMAGLERTLKTQPELKQLELFFTGNTDKKGAFPFTPDIVPSLVSLKAALYDAAEIVPGRPLKVLNISTVYGALGDVRSKSMVEAEERFRMLAHSTSGITDLSFTSRSRHGMFRRIDLHWVPRYLPRLERLSFSDGLHISDDLVSRPL